MTQFSEAIAESGRLSARHPCSDNFDVVAPLMDIGNGDPDLVTVIQSEAMEEGPSTMSVIATHYSPEVIVNANDRTSELALTVIEPLFEADSLITR